MTTFNHSIIQFDSNFSLVYGVDGHPTDRFCGMPVGMPRSPHHDFRTAIKTLSFLE